MTGQTYTVDVRRLEAFSALELHAMFQMRVAVFVVEQKCPYAEIDDKDVQCHHLRLLAGDELIASARLLPPDHHGAPHIGRVVVSPAHRGKRLGEALMHEAIAACGKLYPGQPIELSAQAHLQEFYGSLGFEPMSAGYIIDDIPHVDMRRAPHSTS